MTTPFIGEIVMFGGSFAPRGWALCDGQLIAISSNEALFSLLGTNYGGDGRSTFALPDLRGRSATHAGSGPGLSPMSLGQKGGIERQTLSEQNMPNHNHALHAENKVADQTNPIGMMLGRAGNDTIYEAPASSPNVAMASDSITTTGGGQPFNVHDPYTVVNFIIALQGVFPSRN